MTASELNNLSPKEKETLAREKYDYTKIVVKHRFKLDRALDDYKETIYDKVIRTESKRVFRSLADKVGQRLFCILYRDENFETQYVEYDIEDWTFTVLHCTDFKVVF